MSSREIASTLYVSTRTVDNHLQHAYEKLGVSNRGELGDALARAGYSGWEVHRRTIAEGRTP